MKRFILTVFALLIMFSQPVQANLEYYGIENTINDDLSVNNQIVLEFREPINQLDYQFNFDISNLQAKSDFSSADCNVKDGNIISCNFIGMSEENKTLTLTFDTNDAVKKQDGKFQFVANYGFLPTNRTFIIIRLPQAAILSEDVARESFSPDDGNIASDGKRIFVYWEREDVENENIPFSVSYSFPTEVPSVIIVGLTILVIVVMVGVVVYARKKQQPVEVIASVLNHDEKAIVEVLKRQEGKALQKVLVRETDFSKAKVSRIVKELKERGVVNTEAVSGRENRIILTMGEKTEKPKESN